jgi:hypothetical protein
MVRISARENTIPDWFWENWDSWIVKSWLQCFGGFLFSCTWSCNWCKFPPEWAQIVGHPWLEWFIDLLYTISRLLGSLGVIWHSMYCVLIVLPIGIIQPFHRVLLIPLPISCSGVSIWTSRTDPSWFCAGWKFWILESAMNVPKCTVPPTASRWIWESRNLRLEKIPLLSC